jgi:hypothetical protein
VGAALILGRFARIASYDFRVAWPPASDSLGMSPTATPTWAGNPGTEASGVTVHMDSANPTMSPRLSLEATREIKRALAELQPGLRIHAAQFMGPMLPEVHCSLSLRPHTAQGPGVWGLFPGRCGEASMRRDRQSQVQRGTVGNDQFSGGHLEATQLWTCLRTGAG